MAGVEVERNDEAARGEQGRHFVTRSPKLIPLPLVGNGVPWIVLPKIGGDARSSKDKGLNGFDFAHRIKGSVPVQATDHRKRRCNHISADSHQRDYALAA